MAGRLEGYRESEHTADWELHVWAEDLSGLFEQAARGMYALSGVRLSEAGGGRRAVREIRLDAQDSETLLVDFLSELLLLGETERLGFDEFDLDVSPTRLEGTLSGGPITGQEKEIKAVTFHHLSIRYLDGRIEVDIVFDV